MPGTALGRRGVSGLLVGLLAVAILLPAAPARAASNGLQFSLDGVAWSDVAPSSVFPSGYHLVPGTSVSSVLHVRNDRATPARFTAVIGDRSWTDRATGAVIHLAGSDAAGHGLAATALTSLADCAALVPSRVLANGDEVEITATLSMPADVGGTQGQGGDVDFRLDLALSDLQMTSSPNGCAIPGASIPASPGGSGSTSGALGATGVELLGETLTVSVVVGALGAILMLVARRRHRDEVAAAIDDDESLPS